MAFPHRITTRSKLLSAAYGASSPPLIVSISYLPPFPLNHVLCRHIIIECKKGVKIQQNKIDKLVLRMKSLLYNQNNSIMDAILVWKKNLDKEFEGVEECP